MKIANKAFLRATLAMIGTIIGAGIFALPMAMKTAGILAGSIIYWLIVLVILFAHLMYADLILNLPDMRKKRLPGYAEVSLGTWAKYYAYLAHALHTVSACLAYLILAGEFLALLARWLHVYDDVFTWQIIFWLFGAITIFFGLKYVAKIESWLTWGLIAAIILAIFFYVIKADGTLFIETDWLHGIRPIGVFLFSIFGLLVIPEIADICNHDKYKTRLAIGIGTLTSAFVMWLFAVFAYAAMGRDYASHTQLAFGLPESFFWLIPLVGFLAVATSFLTLTQDFKAMLFLDAKLPKKLAWIIALGSPLLLFLFTTRDFLTTVEFSGFVFSGANGFLVAIMVFAVRDKLYKESNIWRKVVIPCVVASVFLSAVIWRILVSII